MSKDDDLPVFRPNFGKRDRGRTATAPPRFRNGVLANLRGAARAGGTARHASRSRVAMRAPGAASRRVVVKVHVSPMRSGGAKAAALHLRYIERDGVEKDGAPGRLYGAQDAVLARDFETPRVGEAHQFRVIVSPEDAGELDLAAYVCRFMQQVDRDLGQRLEWAAVNHYDTDHPHAHIVVRGVDRDGDEVRLDRAYVAHGLRARAQELATDELGPRPEQALADQRVREVEQDRFTSLDRQLEKRAVGDRVELNRAGASRGSGQTERLLRQRLQHLEALRLAERTAKDAWSLVPQWAAHLRDMGMRGDIIKQMHRALHGDPARYDIVTPGRGAAELAVGSSAPVCGRVVAKGLSDELRGAYYAVVETPSGGGVYVPLDKRVAEEVRQGDLVVLATRSERWLRRGDEVIARIAEAHGGVIDTESLARPSGEQKRESAPTNVVDLQYLVSYLPGRLRGDMSGGEIVEAMERRLAQLQKLGFVTRSHDGKWAVGDGLVAKLEAKDRLEPRRRLVVQRERLPLREQVQHLGPVWLDRFSNSDGLAPYGLGAEVRRAWAERRQVLLHHGISPEGKGRPAAIRELGRRALAKRLAAATGAQLVDRVPRGFRGELRLHDREPGAVTYAAISDGQRFLLVPANRELRALDGQTVSVATDGKGRVKVRPDDRERGPS